MIAALYVETNGAYFGLPGVDPWDERRDARKYDGPYAAVAHPPCQRWGKLWAGQPLYIKRTGIRQKKGDDGGCFEHALATVRKHGGVIEHPWGSHAWPHFGLRVPSRSGGWVRADDFGGWTCCVEQGKYGHYARKPTMLVVYGLPREELPELSWGVTKWVPDPEVVARMGLKRAKRLGELCAKGGGRDSKPRIATPQPFRDLLLRIVRSVAVLRAMKGERLNTSFERWASSEGYDVANTYDTDRSRLVFLNPMTADLWKCWQAAHGVQADVAATESRA